MWRELGYKVYLMGKGIMEWREKGAKGKEEAVVTSSEEGQRGEDGEKALDQLSSEARRGDWEWVELIS